MEEFLANLGQYLQKLSFWAYPIIFLFSFLESLAFVGILFPGMILIVVGYLCYLGQLHFSLTFLFAVTGAILADFISYHIGRKKGVDLKLGQKSIFKYFYHAEAGKLLLDGGGLSIIVGRLIGPTRAFVPFYMGAAGEKERRFILYDLAGVIVWAAFYLLLGYLFGDSYELVKKFINGAEFLAIAVIIFAGCSYLVARLFKKKLQTVKEK